LFSAYDPNEPNFILYATQQSLAPFVAPPNGKGPVKRRRGDKSRKGIRDRPPRTAFAFEGPIKDRNRTAIVVENIPEENFNEESVRGFFSQFGQIQEISMRPYKRLAVLKFDTWDSANAAYQCPKAIFENRFVKVYWYKEEADVPTKGSGGSSDARAEADGHQGEPEFDMNEFLRKQNEAQKIFEMKKQRRAELLKQKEELDKRQQELLERQLEVKRKLEAKLGNTPGSSEGTDGGNAAGNSTTESLRAQLMKLEEEARILGLDPNSDTSPLDEFVGGPVRGGYRGRGAGFRGSSRGRGSRGGYRGGFHGGFGDVHEAYAAYSLDNRPRRIAVTGVDFTAPEKDEALRQFLLVSLFLPWIAVCTLFRCSCSFVPRLCLCALTLFITIGCR
jgi:hypothetical protein